MVFTFSLCSFQKPERENTDTVVILLWIITQKIQVQTQHKRENGICCGVILNPVLVPWGTRTLSAAPWWQPTGPLGWCLAHTASHIWTETPGPNQCSATWRSPAALWWGTWDILELLALRVWLENMICYMSWLARHTDKLWVSKGSFTSGFKLI